ncbi:MAG TPA: hypothetical protein VKV15_28340 [Bryobacteraceae bacterium]|nr:hypothetical protein [Bryobacteraceae bacterium]
MSALIVPVFADPGTVSYQVNDLGPLPVYVASLNGYGGEFTGEINGADANFWCVDSQNDASLDTTYTGYLTSITLAGWNAADTRYGDVPDLPTIGWTFGNSTDSALLRLRIAAYLTTQYNQSLGGSATFNQDVLQAIWSATATNPQTLPGSAPFNATDPSIVGLYNSAVKFVANNWTGDESFWAGFSIVSGWQGNGALADYGPNQVQTFVTQTPAPEADSLILLLTAAAVLFGALKLAPWMRAAVPISFE